MATAPAPTASYAEWRAYIKETTGLSGTRLTEATREAMQAAGRSPGPAPTPSPTPGGPDDPPDEQPAPGFKWVWSGSSWVETPLGRDEQPSQPLPEGYEWVWNDQSQRWGFRQIPVTEDPDGTSPSPDRPPTSAPPEGYEWFWEATVGNWVLRQKTTPAPPVEEDTTERETAKEIAVRALMELGFNTDNGWFTQQDIDDVVSAFDEWITDGFRGDQLYTLFRTDAKTKAIYQKRFPGMAALAARGQAMSEGEYIQLESQYRKVLSSYGLPTSFYDRPDDYGKFIGNDVSVNEVEDRVRFAKQALDSANPYILSELEDYYGVTSDTALAYLLDADKAQNLIREQSRAAQIGGAATRYGFKMSRAQSELLGDMSAGADLDPFQSRTLTELESTFGQARRVADRERVLAGIDREAYTEMDTLRSAFGDQDKALESQKRARRERSRFSGSAGASAASLSVDRNL